MPDTIPGYVIQDIPSGLYARKGFDKAFSKKPHVWSSLGAIKNHIQMVGYVNEYSMDYCTVRCKILKLYQNARVIDISTGNVVFETLPYFLEVINKKKKAYPMMGETILE